MARGHRQKQASAAEWVRWWDATTTLPVADDRPVEDAVALVGRAPVPGLSPTDSARDILAGMLGVAADELAGLSTASAATALARLTDVMHRLGSAAAIDDLTGALRRGAGLAAARQEIQRSRRGSGRLVVAVVDVDGLKAVNDGRGHVAGDQLLRDVVAAMRSQLRSYDLIVRYGGDEFICVLADAALGDAELRFREVGFALAVATGGRTVSVGLASLTEADTLDDLIARADAALYAGRRRRTRRNRSS